MPRLTVACSASANTRPRMSQRIYLDNHATTRVDPRVVEVMTPYFVESYGNPSSADHAFGDDAERAVAAATAQLSHLVRCEPDEVVFTSGATESVNLAFVGFTRSARRRLGRVPRVAISAVEHSAVSETARVLAKEGLIDLTVIPVDSCARLDLESLQRVASRGLDLVSVMAANNEVGTLYPLAAIGQIASESGAAFLCDATQAVGKISVDVARASITFLALSAHKFYGPKGVGALVVTRGAPFDSISHGGGHQFGRRPGTLNVPGIVGLGEACRLRDLEMGIDEPRIGSQRDVLQDRLLSELEEAVVNGAGEARLAGNLHFSIPGVPNQAIVARVRDRLAIATGAACSSGIEAPSPVLRAMGLPESLQAGALRIGLGRFTTDSDIDEAADVLLHAVRSTRATLAT